MKNCNNAGAELTRKHGQSPSVLISVQPLLPHYPDKENKNTIIEVKSKMKISLRQASVPSCWNLTSVSVALSD